MQDRVPTPGKENRIRIRLDDGQAIEGVLEYADEATVQGSAYNKASVLPDSTCSTLELPTSAEPKDAFEHAALPEYGLRIGDLIGSERNLSGSFLTASGGTYSKSAYPDLYKLIGTNYGFGRTISKTIAVPNTTNDRGVYASVVCNRQGMFCVLYELYTNDHLAVGKLTNSEAKLIHNVQSEEGLCAVVDDNDFLYTMCSYSSKLVIRKYNGSGEVKNKTISSPNWVHIAENIDGDILVGSSEELYQLDTETLSLTKIATLERDANYGIAKAGNYYFCRDYRGTSWSSMSTFSIPGESSSVETVKQMNGFVILKAGSNIYKTTNGTSFTKIFTGLSGNSEYQYAHFAFTSDGIHKFSNSVGAEVWYKSTPISISSAGTQASLSRKPAERAQIKTNLYIPSISANMESDDGFLVPYVESDTGGIGVQLVPKDFSFKLPTYNCGGKYLKIKAKKTGV